MKKIKWFAMILIAAFAIVLAGCDALGMKGDSENDLQSSDYYIFYTNQSKTELIPRPCDINADATDPQAMIEEMLAQIQVEPESVEYWKVLPETVTINDYEYLGGILTLDFCAVYNEMKIEQEILCRGAISRDFLQIPGVSFVRFRVDGQPLKDAEGNEVGLISTDSFLTDTAVDRDDMQEKTITLYFASEDGQSLVKEYQTIHYPSSMSIEKAVMRRLLNGPQNEAASPSLPSGTNLISVSVMDGVCLVNLDESFLVQDFNVSEKIVIYSIVDSLTALDSVDMVQISVNGDTNLTYRNSISLSESFTENLEYCIN